MIKEIMTMVFDVFVFFTFTFIWNWYHGVPDVFMKSAVFSVYLAIIFFIYRFIFNIAWNKNLKN